MSEVRPKGERKARHRQALIDATIVCISEFGIVGTSVTRIIDEANLSRGMISLHFSSKDELLAETERYMDQQYYVSMNAFLATAGEAPQDVLEAIIVADLSPEILNHSSVNVWHAFRGQARLQRAIAHYADTRDVRLRRMMLEAFVKLAGQTKGSESLARDATNGTIALLEGMWSDYLMHSDEFSRETAKRIVFRFLSSLFPKFFNLSGAISKQK